MRDWIVAAITLAIVYMLLVTFMPGRAEPAAYRHPILPLDPASWCYWEKGLAKKRLREADMSWTLVPLN